MVLKRNFSTDDLSDPAPVVDPPVVEGQHADAEPETLFDKQPESPDPSWTLDAFAPYQPESDPAPAVSPPRPEPEALNWAPVTDFSNFGSFDAVPLTQFDQTLPELQEHDHSLLDASASPVDSSAYLDEPVPQATVTVRLGSLSASYALDRPEMIIGRPDPEIGHQPDISIEWDDSISRRHARLIQHDGLDYVEDMGSTNGTLLNGAVLVPHDPLLLHAGDIMQLGLQTEIVYYR